MKQKMKRHPVEQLTSPKRSTPFRGRRSCGVHRGLHSDPEGKEPNLGWNRMLHQAGWLLQLYVSCSIGGKQQVQSAEAEASTNRSCSKPP
jgi:hypothetical protein